MVDSDSHEFVKWVDLIPSYTGTPHAGITAEVFVHTAQNEVGYYERKHVNEEYFVQFWIENLVDLFKSFKS